MKNHVQNRCQNSDNLLSGIQLLIDSYDGVYFTMGKNKYMYLAHSKIIGLIQAFRRPNPHGYRLKSKFSERKTVASSLRMIRASLNRGSRLGPKTSVQGKPCAKPWDMKILQVFFNIRGEILVFSKKC